MNTHIYRLFSLLEQQTIGVRWVLTIVTMMTLGLFDYYTGFEISFSFFYLIPVSLAAWSIGQRAGFGVAVACALIWLAANLFAGQQFSSAFMPYWNALTRVGFFFVVALLLSMLRQLLDRERSLARTDFLTGVLNSRAFYSLADTEIARLARHGRPFTVLYLDLDNFKMVNDRWGHHTGDELLQSVAQSMLGSIRVIDSAARLGGDEFVVLLPDTDAAQAQIVALRIQSALLIAMQRHSWPVTFSIGALTCLKAPSDSQALIQLADALMYRVKTTGKNGISYAVYTGAGGSEDEFNGLQDVDSMPNS